MSVRHFTRQACHCLGLIACCAVLAACGGSRDKGATQAAAKVNSGEITVHQINQVLEQQPGLRPEQVDTAARHVLERLIDQELAVQQAAEQKLDREPRVVAAIEAAKRDIIARAYLDKVGGPATPPTPTEVQAYYEAHPGLFSNRKVYQLQEVTVEVAAEQQPELVARLKSFRGPADFVNWLQSQSMHYSAVQTTQPAENLAIGLVDQLSKLNDGQAISQAAPQGLKLVFVLAARPAPVSLDKSRTAIERFIVNDRKRTAVQEELKHLRTAAKIEYLGKFAEASAGAKAAPAAAEASATAAPAEAAPTAPATSSTPAATTGMDATTLKKGLGLK